MNKSIAANRKSTKICAKTLQFKIKRVFLQKEITKSNNSNGKTYINIMVVA